MTYLLKQCSKYETDCHNPIQYTRYTFRCCRKSFFDLFSVHSYILTSPSNSSFPASPPCTSIPLTLHLGHGLRPIKKIKIKFAYVRAQRKFAFALFCMAHCQRANPDLSISSKTNWTITLYCIRLFQTIESSLFLVRSTYPASTGTVAVVRFYGAAHPRTRDLSRW